MQVVLRNHVEGLGKRGDIVDVAPGYARNFLFPQGHAIKASPGTIAQAARMRRARDLKEQNDREAATAVASALVPKVITISAKASDEGRLFGSVSAADVSTAVAEQTGIEIDRKAIQIDDPIKTVGDHAVTAVLHTDVSFPIRLEVVASE
ncbi:MAG: 50S ribosomal protein L9 [Ilumatobacter coccineus]|uniref:Large ribosomal subunit protein bL9 n=1 Tax=Ilumatobacter coccineus TaxID=467094 RepID=A0A2G6K841_9ACTN|nr:MAG: 50S ribosomal protein L9 [Ilumatobacter coccineus]